MIGDIIKKLRQENKLSQKQLADKIGTSQAAIYYWESGKREPRFDVIKKLADVFDVTMDNIIGMEQDKQFTNIHLGGSPMTEREQKLLADFRKLNTEGQQYILQTMDMVKDKYKKSDSIPGLEDIG